jgi:hypothetical protein
MIRTGTGNELTEAALLSMIPGLVVPMIPGSTVNH